MITPREIRAKATRLYPAMLAAWLGDEQLAEFFPRTLRARLSPARHDLPEAIAAVAALRAESKQHRGSGYTVHWKQRRSRDFGQNWFPERISIDTLDDLLHLAGRRREFAATCRVVARLRAELPELAPWLERHIRTTHRLAESIDGLIEVARYFRDHPWPDCYARQIPVAVDTKFIERHRNLLRAWLDLLLPASAIDTGETKFALRFGLRDGQQHTAVRTLDPQLQAELALPFDELSLPLRSLARLPVRSATVLIVENRLNLLTLPPLPRGLGICGGGNAVTLLRKLAWLGHNRVVYWGDIDAEGFHLLSRLRSLVPGGHVESILMDRATLDHHAEAVVAGNAPPGTEPPELDHEERATYRRCAAKRQRLEQEKIVQNYVESRFADLAGTCPATPIAGAAR